MRSTSFILYKGARNVNLNTMALRLNGCSKPAIFNHKFLKIAFNSTQILNHYKTIENWHIWQLVTSVNNHVDKASSNQILDLIKGDNSSLSKFNFSFIAYNDVTDVLTAFNSAPGVLPIYYRIEEDEYWLTSELKSCILNPYFNLEMQPFEFVLAHDYMYKNADDCIIKSFKRLLPDHSFTLKNHAVNIQHQAPLNVLFHLKPATLIADNLYHLINNYLIKVSAVEANLGLTLSGGYDSGSMAGMLSKISGKTPTFTVGTKNTNEFDDAALIAKHFKLDNHQSILSERAYIKAYIQSLYINEINDSVVAEAYPILFKLYEFTSGFVSHLCMGYGADIILGNILDSNEDVINTVARSFLMRTATTGELSPFLADHFGVQTYSPYLTRELIDYCLSIPSQLKQKHGLNKYIQRLMIVHHGLLPTPLINQKKKALHDGAGIPNLFSQILNISESNQTTKKRFLYLAWEQLFIKGKAIGEFDIKLLIDKSKLIAI